MMHSTPDIPCDSTVAKAAPNTPMLNTRMKSKSRPIFRTAAIIRKITGTTELPRDLRYPDSRLYSIVAGMPANMTIRYW